jgi:hypothetical protein
MPEKFTPEEYEVLAESPADSPNLVDDELDKAADAPEGVVEDPPEG